MNEEATARVGPQRQNSNNKKKSLIESRATPLKILLTLKSLGITLRNNTVASHTPKSSSTEGHHAGSSTKIR